MNFIKKRLIAGALRNEAMTCIGDKFTSHTKQLLLIIFLSLGVLACSSDNDEPVNSLKLPSIVNVVAGKSTLPVTANSVTSSQRVALNAALTDPDTDYSTDVAGIFQLDAAGIETGQANYMLCIIEKFKYSEQLNAGPYNIAFNFYDCIERLYPGLIGLVEKSEFLVEGTINSTRVNNNSPQIISAWLSFDVRKKKTDDPKELENIVLLEVTILNGVSDEYPYGNFILNVTDVGDAGNYGSTVGEEYISNYFMFKSTSDKDKKPTVKMASIENLNSTDVTTFVSTTVSWSPENLDKGSMRTLETTKSSSDPESNTSTSTLLDFDENNVLLSRYDKPSEIISNQSCLSRSEFIDQNWAYNLYHDIDGQFRGDSVGAGDRVNLTSRIEFTYNGALGSVTNGSFWMAIGETLPDGALITDNASNKLYTAHVVNGELTKITKIELSLTTLQGRQFSYFGTHPRSGSLKRWILELDENNDFSFLKVVQYNAGGEVLSDTFDHDNDPLTAEVPVAAKLVMTNGKSISIRDDAYKSYQYIHDQTLAAIDRLIKYEDSRKINAANTDLFSDTTKNITLYCYKSCPKGGLTQSDVDLATKRSELYYSYYLFSNTPSVYTLKHTGFKVELFDATNDMLVDISQLDFSNKYFSSYFSTSDMTTVALPAGATADQLNMLDVSFNWIMNNGYSSYKTVTISDSAGNLVILDAPIEMQLVFDASNDTNNSDPLTNPFQGQTYYLRFSDNYLSGLPYTLVGSNYVRDISLKDGTLLPSVEGNFVTRASLIARNLMEKPADICSALTLDGLVDRPSLTLMTETDLDPVPFTVADRPVVSSPTIF